MESELTFNHQYSLKWHDFQQKLINSFQNLQKSDDFVDVTIACEEKSFSAHKVVLSACSPYFRKLLKANPCPHPIIILQTIKQKHFENLLNFMYHGVVNIETDSLQEFLKSASALQIQGLADIQFPNTSRRKISTESDCSGFNDEECVSPRQKRRNEEQDYNNTEKSSQPDLSSIDTIIDMNLPSPTSNNQKFEREQNIDNDGHSLPKIEPIDDLIIDEDAFEQNDSQSETQRTEMPSFSGNINYPEQFSSRATSMSESFLAKKNKDIANEGNQCIVCKRNYSSPSNLRAHVLNVHIQTSKTNWFECRVCGKKCKTKHYLINHEMQKHGIRQRSKRASFAEFISEDSGQNEENVYAAHDMKRRYSVNVTTETNEQTSNYNNENKIQSNFDSTNKI